MEGPFIAAVHHQRTHKISNVDARRLVAKHVFDLARWCGRFESGLPGIGMYD